MTGRGRGGGHGRSIICVSCRGQFPINRKNLRLSRRPGGFVCARCQSGKTRRRQRPSDYK